MSPHPDPPVFNAYGTAQFALKNFGKNFVVSRKHPLVFSHVAFQKKFWKKFLLFPGGGPLFLLVCVLKKNSGKIFGNFGVVLVIYIHNTYIMLDRIIKESISRVIIEKLEIESFGNIDLDAIAKKMFSMYNSGGGNDIIKMNGNTYYLSIQINPNETRKGSGGFFGNDIFFSFPPRMDFSVNYFKSLIAHELTHAFNKGKAYPYRRPSHSYLKFSFSTNTPNDFNRERYTCWQQTPIVYRYTDSNAVRNGCI